METYELRRMDFQVLMGLMIEVLTGMVVLIAMMALGVVIVMIAIKIYRIIGKYIWGAKKKVDEKSATSSFVPFDTLSLEICEDLIPLATKERKENLIERIRGIRKNLVLELGVIVPPVQIIDNISLGRNEYRIKLNGVVVGKGRLRPDHLLCIRRPEATDEVHGEETLDPVFCAPAVWIPMEKGDEAKQAGYTVFDNTDTIVMHISKVATDHAADFLGVQYAQTILDGLCGEYPAVMNEITHSNFGMPLSKIQKILQGLLREKVSIWNIVVILETIIEHAPPCKDTSYLVEKKLGRRWVARYANNTPMWSAS